MVIIQYFFHKYFRSYESDNDDKQESVSTFSSSELLSTSQEFGSQYRNVSVGFQQQDMYDHAKKLSGLMDVTYNGRNRKYVDISLGDCL